MVVLDFSIVNVAIPSIQAALGFSAEGVQWLLTSYGLVFGGFMLLGGRLSDLYGRRRIFCLGTGLFTLASLVGGLSASAFMLVAMRAAQGLGAALLSPAALALLMEVFEEGPTRNRAYGIWGVVAASGYSIGVILGGLLTASLGWRFILFVNVPVGLGIIVVALRVLPKPIAAIDAPRLDILGSVLVTSGLMLLVYGLTEASLWGWTNPKTWLVLATALLLLAVFYGVERRVAQPLMPMNILLAPGIAAANACMSLVSAALVAMNLVLTLYFQHVLHYSPWLTGLAFLPHGIAATLAGPLGSRMANRFGSKAAAVFGLAVIFISMALLAFIGTQDTYWYHVMPVTVLLSLGAMPAFINLTLLATSGSKPEDHGLVSGLINTTGQLGGAFGLGVLIAVAATRTGYVLSHGSMNPAEALLSGYRFAFAVAAGMVALGMALAWLGLRHVKPETAALVP